MSERIIAWFDRNWPDWADSAFWACMAWAYFAMACAQTYSNLTLLAILGIATFFSQQAVLIWQFPEGSADAKAVQE